MNQLLEKQKVVRDILLNSFELDRVSHAYLFHGQRGTGKMEMALHFTQLYLCDQPLFSEPCGECSNCKRIRSGNHPDVHIVKPDGQSIKKEQIQMLQKEFSLSGVESSKKVYIIEHIDKMTISAANSLLKFLEEPHRDTLAILLTEQPHKLLDTIISRCQTLSFTPLSTSDFIHLLEKEGVSGDKAAVLAALTNNFHEAIELNNSEWFENAIHLTSLLTKEWMNSNHLSIPFIQEKWITHFDKETQDLGIELLMIWVMDLLHMKLNMMNRIGFRGFIDELKRQSSISTITILNIIKFLTDVKKKMKSNVNYQLLLENLTIQVLKEISHE